MKKKKKKNKILLSVCIGFILSIFIYACAKDESNLKSQKFNNEIITSDQRTRTPSTNNVIETATVLGRQRNNPFTISNMTLAFNTIYKTSLTTLPATHKYVKFMPATGEHLAALQNWELNTLTPIFDFPLLNEVTTIGEYYVDPTVQESVYTYRYASVPVNVILPIVPNTLIAELFIPPLNSYVAEQAFYQVGEIYEGDTSPHPENPEGPGDGDDPDDDCNPGCDNYPCCKVAWNDCDEYPCGGDVIGSPCMPGSPDWPRCLGIFPPPAGPGGGPNGDPDPDFCECTEYVLGEAVKTWKVQINPGEDCSKFEQGWGTGNGIECSGIIPPPPPPVVNNDCGCPIPANPKFPAGCIQVDRDGTDVGVQRVMVKLKDNWFSGDITFTTNAGCWQVNKEYSNYVWMWVQFENSNCEVRAVRGNNYTKALVVADDYVDRFNAPPYNNIFVRYSDGSNNNLGLARMYWACAHTINSDNEYRIAAGGDGVILPRVGLNYLLLSDRFLAGTPMLQSHPFSLSTQLLISYNLPSGAANIAEINAGTLLSPDIVRGYDLESASAYKMINAHELGHSSHYQIVGEPYWFPYRSHIVNNDLAGNGVYGAFGNFAAGSDPGRVALGEALGNFTGNRYGGTFFGGENGEWVDFFIPAGLMHDLGDIDVDIVTDPNPPITSSKTGPDNISGFTPAMIYGALTPNVNSIRSFRDRLRTNSLASTPNTASAYNTFVNIYDVFN
jgi:hypothetical protein